MILKGSQRAGGRQLAAHLLKTTENEHVEVHELRGFMANDLHSAFNEIYAVSKGTRAQQPFFSLSLSPPPAERVSIDTFEAAIEQAKRAGLNPKDMKRVFQDCWAISDSRSKAFAQALHSQGLVLARGDRRGFVAIDYQGEVYAIAKYTGARTKAVRKKLGDPSRLKGEFRKTSEKVERAPKREPGGNQDRGYEPEP
jgi:hypothetical protein